MDKLTDDFEHGRVDLSTIGGLQYQKLVFGKLVDSLFENQGVLKVENCDKGPVDYIVHEVSGGGMLGKSRKHYFECKNYGRSLELDSVAKIMVVAVAEQPDSVHVVSRTGLQPQIVSYASRLFDVGDHGSPIFKSIAFHHWQTDHLLKFQASIFSDGDSHVREEPKRAPLWWLTECAAFSETEIASSNALPVRQLWLRHGCLLHLTLQVAENEPAFVELLGIPEESWVPVAPVEGGVPEAIRRTYLVNTSQLDPAEQFRVSIQITSGMSETRIPVGDLRFGGSDSMLPELRQKEVDEIVRQVGPIGNSRLLLVEGEAGAGKTHFVEKMAEVLRARHGIDVACFSITKQFQETLLATLLRACLTPPIHQASFQEVASAVQRALLSDEIDAQTADANVGLLARLAIRMGPRLIVLRDCELLSEPVANHLWALIVALNDAGWGGVRLVLEYRQPEANLNEAFRLLIENVNLRIHGVRLKKLVRPLTSDELSIVSKKLFNHVTPEIITCLAHRTGGLPLFIENYLRRLLELGFIERNDSYPRQFSITQPARLLADVLPASGALILEHRVKAWLHDCFTDDVGAVVMELGLIAVADIASSQSLMRDALQMSPERLRTIHRALDKGGVGTGRPDGDIVFQHDLLRTALVSVARSHAGFDNFASRTAGALLAAATPQNELQIRYLRSRIFSTIGDRVALEIELRLGIRVADNVSDYGRLMSFLAQLLDILPADSNIEERLDLMNQLAWAAWVSDSLPIARQRYLHLAEEAEQITTGDFSFAEAIATDAYRRAIGIDLELMEPQVFLENAIAVLKRRQTLVTFNSIVNRLVLFCARFGHPQSGYDFAKITFSHIGNGLRENEGAVICSELGALYAHAEPGTALSLFQQGVAFAGDDYQRLYNVLDVLVLESLHQGIELDLRAFGTLWNSSTQGRFSEILTRASLLRGSIFLRSGDLANAGKWIAKTSTMVDLYHRKEFELPVLNDLMIASLLAGDTEQVQSRVATLARKFDKLLEQHDVLTRRVPLALDACRRAAEKLPIERSLLELPQAPPKYCGVFSDMWYNIATIARRVGMGDLSRRYATPPEWLGAGRQAGNRHRLVVVDGLELTVGAY